MRECLSGWFPMVCPQLNSRVGEQVEMQSHQRMRRGRSIDASSFSEPWPMLLVPFSLRPSLSRLRLVGPSKFSRQPFVQALALSNLIR